MRARAGVDVAIAAGWCRWRLRWLGERRVSRWERAMPQHDWPAVARRHAQPWSGERHRPPAPAAAGWWRSAGCACCRAALPPCKQSCRDGARAGLLTRRAVCCLLSDDAGWAGSGSCQLVPGGWRDNLLRGPCSALVRRARAHPPPTNRAHTPSRSLRARLTACPSTLSGCRLASLLRHAVGPPCARREDGGSGRRGH